MPQRIAKSHDPRRVHRQGCRAYAAHFKPAELHRKHANCKSRKEERGKAYTHHRKHGDGIVHKAILVSCRLDAERNCDYKLQNGCDKRNRKGYAHVLHNDVGHRSLILEGHSQIAFEKVAEPVEIALDYRHKLVSARCNLVGHIDAHRLSRRQGESHVANGAIVHARRFVDNVSAALDGSDDFVKRDHGVFGGFFAFGGFVGFCAAACHLANAEFAAVENLAVGISVRLDDDASVFAAVKRPLVPSIVTLYAESDIFVIRDFFGVFGERFACKLAVVANREMQIRVRHGKPVQFFDTVNVFLFHSALLHRRRVLIVNVVGRHHTRERVYNDGHTKQNHDGQKQSFDYVF